MRTDTTSRTGIAVALLLSVLAVWIVIQGSAVEYRPAEAERALLRLSWRLSAEVGEICRPATEEELAELPVHMRTDEICEPMDSGFDLVVTLDEDTLVAERLEGRGARGDRPISILREWPLAPGKHRLTVRLTPVGEVGDRTGAGEVQERELERTVEVAPGEVVVVAIQPETGRLILIP